MNAPLAPMTPQPVRLTTADFLLLDRAGAFADHRKTELIDGVILAVNAQFVPHGYAKMELAYRLRRALEAMGSDLYVHAEVSVALSPHSMPEPDIILSRARRVEGPLPLAAVALLVEVAASTQRLDLFDKARIYARAGVPEYWVLDVEGPALHQFLSPGPDGYAEHREPPLGEPLAASTIPGLSVETNDLA